MSKTASVLKKLQQLSYSFLFSSSLFFSTTSIAATQLSNNESVELLGIGLFHELRNDIYVGSLMVPDNIKSVDGLFDPYLAKRMSLRFLSPYSPRQVTRHWKERLAMNNARESWRPYTKEIIQFTSVFKQNFETGDEINLDYIPGKGTEVRLNGTLFQTIEAPQFYDLLLNVWLGATPPTQDFKKTIRGDFTKISKDDLWGRYSSLTVKAGRFDALLNSSEPTASQSVASSEASQTDNPQAVQVADKGSTKSAKKPEKVTKPDLPSTHLVASSKPPEPASQPAVQDGQSQKASTASLTESLTAVISTSQTEKQLLPAANQSTQVAAKSSDSIQPQAIQQPAANTQSTELASLSSGKQETQGQITSGKIEKPAETKVAMVTTPSKPIKQSPAIEEDFFDADLFAGSYTRDLLNAVRKNQSYPKKAAMAGEQGDIVAKVVIDQSGEIVSLDLIEKSGSRELDKGAIRMIRKSAPFEAIPKELNQQTFEFDVPISFKL